MSFSSFAGNTVNIKDAMTAASGQMFDPSKSMRNVNVSQELSGSMQIADATRGEILKMQELADAIGTLAAANGGEIGPASKGRAMAGAAMGEGLSYGASFAVGVFNPALGMCMAVASTARTVHMLNSKINQETSFTPATETTRGNSKRDHVDSEIVFSSGGSQTSLQAAAKQPFTDMGMAAPEPAMIDEGHAYEIIAPVMHSKEEVVEAYKQMLSEGMSNDEILLMAQNFAEDPEYQAMLRQYTQHAEYRPQNIVQAAPQMMLS